MSDLLRALAVLGLIGANAFFVIGEYAVVAGRRAALAARAEAGSRGARAALRLMDEPVRVISTVQVGITAIGILTGAIGEPLVRDIIGPSLPGWAGFLIAFGIVTYLTVVLGELVPKALTLDRADRLAPLVAPPIAWIARALRPAVWLLEGTGRLLLRPFGVTEVSAGAGVRSLEELRAVIDEAEGTGVIRQAQEELLYRVFDFVSREAGDAMVPAAGVDWLDAGLDVTSALGEVVAHPHSRYPVAEGSLDRPRGIVHVRELVAAAREDPAARVGPLARPAFVVPETKDLGALLHELQERREHVALVVDEYGGTAGLISVADVVARIVGELRDEYDLPDATFTRVDERTVLVAGSASIDDFNETFGTALPQDGPRTLAGLVFDALGRRPQAGDEAEIEDVGFLVEEVSDARIARLRVRLPASARARERS